MTIVPNSQFKYSPIDCLTISKRWKQAPLLTSHFKINKLAVVSFVLIKVHGSLQKNLLLLLAASHNPPGKVRGQN